MRGEIRVFLYNPASEILENIVSVFLVVEGHARAVEIESFRFGNKCCLVGFDGITSRASAEALKGANVCVARSMLPPLPSDEFYVTDLIGCEAWQGETLLGTVSSSRPQGGIEVVTVTDATHAVEIPLVEDFVVNIDIAGKRLDVFDTDDLPRSLLRRHRG